MEHEERLKLFEDNQKLVYTVINKHFQNAEDKEDLKQIGLMALWNATERYVKDKGIKFSTYAYKAIKNNVACELRTQHRNDKYATTSTFSELEENEFSKLAIDERLVQRILTSEEIITAFDYLNESEKKIVKLLVAGYRQIEIARAYKINYQVLCRKVRKIREKLNSIKRRT